VRILKGGITYKVHVIWGKPRTQHQACMLATHQRRQTMAANGPPVPLSRIVLHVHILRTGTSTRSTANHSMGEHVQYVFVRAGSEDVLTVTVPSNALCLREREF